MSKLRDNWQKTIWGGLRKIKDTEIPCTHPGHNPPMHIVLEPGEYEYMCPACGKITTFTVPRIMC